MASSFAVVSTPQFDRQSDSLRRRHRGEFTAILEEALGILSQDPHNRTGHYHIKKLTAVPPGDAQYRLRLRRFRFRYDIEGDRVVLKRCSLRREDTY